MNIKMILEFTALIVLLSSVSWAMERDREILHYEGLLEERQAKGHKIASEDDADKIIHYIKNEGIEVRVEDERKDEQKKEKH
jgi:hypothetical protein